jgi:hypothetical protein
MSVKIRIITKLEICTHLSTVNGCYSRHITSVIVALLSDDIVEQKCPLVTAALIRSKVTVAQQCVPTVALASTFGQQCVITICPCSHCVTPSHAACLHPRKKATERDAGP